MTEKATQDAVREGLPFPDTIGEPDDAEDLVGEPAGADDEVTRMRAELEAERARMTSLTDSLVQMTRAQVAAQTAPAPAPEPQMVALDDLPDPVTDREKFNKELAKRVNDGIRLGAEKAAQQATAARGAADDRTAVVDRVWSAFQKDYPELAKRDAHVQGAYLVEAQALKAEGVDPLVVMRANPQSFAKRVADRMKSESGAPTPGRTAGVGGGSNASKGGKTPEPKVKGFLEQHKDRQKAMGLI